MYYLLMYDDEMGDCIHWASFESLEDEGLKRITNDWHNQGVGYKIIKGEIVEDVPGIVFGDGEDIWEPVEDDYCDYQQFDFDEDRPY